jgi:ectoine hydroxylase-related dioxygenase (phytanoyl-CoA dioxygenase family)
MTVEQIRSKFRRDGYCILEAVLTDNKLSGLRSACDLLLKEKPQDGGGKFHDIGRGDARRFLRHRHEDMPEVAAFVFGETMHSLAAALLGDTAYLFNEQFVVKGARTGASFAWHQDGAYVGFDHKPYITVWIALDDTTEENGCVYVLPRNLDLDEGLVPHRWDAEGKEKVGYDGPDRGIPAVVPAGSIVVFSSTTLHSSGANRTDRVRRAYLCQYSPEPIIDPATGGPKHFAKRLAGAPAFAAALS